MPLSNLEVHWIVKEFQPLVGQHFEKMSDLEGGWKLKIGKQEIVVEVPNRIYLTKRKQAAQAPRGFTQYCRKHLRGKVIGIVQPGFDRVVVFELEHGQKLVFELFSRGNAILIGKEGKTEKALRDEEWKDRKIKRGEPYALPASSKLSPLEMTEEQFGKLFGEKDVIHSLVSGIKMSGKYLELACINAGIDKNAEKPNKKLFGAIKSLLKEERILSEEMDEQYGTIDADTTASEKVERKLKQQEEAIVALEEKAELLREKGDFIYTHWKELDELVAKVATLRKQNKNYDEINEMLAGTASINKKTKRMTVKL